MTIEQIVQQHIRGVVTIVAGATYYHGYRFLDLQSIQTHFDRQRWITPDRKYAGDYCYYVDDHPVKRLEAV